MSNGGDIRLRNSEKYNFEDPGQNEEGYTSSLYRESNFLWS